MCGRYSITTNPAQLALRFDATNTPAALAPRYNAAPTQHLPAILNEAPSRIELLRWGLVPSWAKDPKIGARLINARVETAAQKPSFRQAWRQRRCLVLTDGFYEWQRAPQGKVPTRVTLKSGEPFAFAGLWEMWQDTEGVPLRTFTILTTTPNELMAPIHNRMPVILHPEHERLWLDGTAPSTGWGDVLRPYPAEQMLAYPVSPRVNSPRHDEPEVTAPLDASGAAARLP